MHIFKEHYWADQRLVWKVDQFVYFSSLFSAFFNEAVQQTGQLIMVKLKA